MAQATRRLILWFRNDLRVHDNGIINDAIKRLRANEFDEVLPVYVYDPRTFGLTPWSHLKTGAHRAKFVMESVADLKAGLERVGSNLAVAVGPPEVVIPGLLENCAPGGLVLCQEEVTSEELRTDARLARALQAKSAQLRKLWGSTLYFRKDLPFRDSLDDLPDVFTPFRTEVEKRSEVRRPLPGPKKGELPLPSNLDPGVFASTPGWDDLPFPTGKRPSPPTVHPKSVLNFKGGETAALARLKYYLWDSDLLATYFDTRNGMLGGDYSTKFSPWLAAGCISPRLIYSEIKKYEEERTANKSTYWVIFELIWRDYFKFFALKHGNKIFLEGGTVGRKLSWCADEDLWLRWKEGRTGMPLVDANMRELAATGFMSNRGRQNVASYLALDLGVDWRRGADWFESSLSDYDVASNWGNWVAAAGLTGGRINHFNITKQSKDYDPSGDYIRTWVSELARVPPPLIHEPWLMSREQQQQYGVAIGVDYPAPLPVSQLGRPHDRGTGGNFGGRGGYRGNSGNGNNRGPPGRREGEFAGRAGQVGGGRGRPTAGREGGRTVKASLFERFG